MAAQAQTDGQDWSGSGRMPKNVNGIDDILKTLDNLPRAVERKCLRKAMQAGAKVVQKKAVSNLQAQTSDEATGLLARSIVVRVLKTKAGVLRVAVTLAAKKLSKLGVRVGLYGSVLELGKENQVPRPYLAPAAKESAPEVLNVITSVSRSNFAEAVKAAKNGT